MKFYFYPTFTTSPVGANRRIHPACPGEEAPGQTIGLLTNDPVDSENTDYIRLAGRVVVHPLREAIAIRTDTQNDPVYDIQYVKVCDLVVPEYFDWTKALKETLSWMHQDNDITVEIRLP